ncbi:MAG: GNAT family N-acetyltransferase [Pseudomonadota bacterium]|nr:GNAT family N-acetyltransferase [Pseudomonadota bacterium]
MKFVQFGRIRHTPKTADLTVEVATTVGALQALEADYEHLLRTTGNTLPFALHEWHVAWCKEFLESGKRIQTQPMIYAARNTEGRCVAIVPLILTRRTVGPVKVGTLDLLGSDPAITEIRTSIIEPSYETRAIWAIRRKLADVGAVDWLNWCVISDAHALALSSCADLKIQKPLLDYVLDLPASWDEFHSNLKRNIRESIRHCYNSLKREGLTHELRIAREPGEVKDALERFFTLHAMRADRFGTVAHRNHFAKEGSRRFLQEICAKLSARGMVRIFQLAIRGEVVALRIGFVIGDSVYLYYSGYDSRWSKYSVMTTTVVEAIKYAIGQHLTTINLSPNKDVSKTRWGPREIPLNQGVQIAPSLLSHLAWAGFKRIKSPRPPPPWINNVLNITRRHWD